MMIGTARTTMYRPMSDLLYGPLRHISLDTPAQWANITACVTWTQRGADRDGPICHFNR